MSNNQRIYRLHIYATLLCVEFAKVFDSIHHGKIKKYSLCVWNTHSNIRSSYDTPSRYNINGYITRLSYTIF